MAACKIHEKYDWIKCDRPPLESAPDGLCLLHSRQEDKDKEGAFTDAVKEKLEKEDYDFQGVFFPGDIGNFAKHEFKKDAHFSEATFSGGVSFLRATFSGEALFSMATFSGWPSFLRTTFSGRADFSGATFSEGADFSVVAFSGEADFYETTFSGVVSFARATFSREASFYSDIFSGRADFSWATFSGEAGFSEAKFSGRAEFSKATFSEKADFYKATFSVEASFSYATFSEKAKFSGATFSGEADFSWATFSGKAEFIRATIANGGRLFLHYINPPDEKKRRKPFRADFWTLNSEPGARIIFQDFSLAQVELAGTDMTRLTLRNVDWHHYHPPLPVFLIKGLPSVLKSTLTGRQVVYDEILVRKRAWKFWDLFLNYGLRVARRATQGKELKQEEYARVEELYRGLMLNYGGMADHKRVGDFHYGEMEMHRRASPWRRLCSLYSAYWALSGYGERPLRAFIWLVLLIPAWAGVVWGLGIDQAATTNPVSYWDTLLYIFEKVTFQRPQLLGGITWLGKFLSGLSVLLIPGQAALFILALRNRLGRRR